MAGQSDQTKYLYYVLTMYYSHNNFQIRKFADVSAINSATHSVNYIGTPFLHLLLVSSLCIGLVFILFGLTLYLFTQVYTDYSFCFI